MAHPTGPIWKEAVLRNDKFTTVLLILPFSPIAYHDRTPFASPQPKWDLSASLSTHISFDWHLQSHTKSSVHLRCASHTLIPVNNQVATVKTFWQTKPRESKLFPTTIEFDLNTDYRIAHACIGLQLRGVSYIKRVGWLSFLAISLCLLRNNSCEELCCPRGGRYKKVTRQLFACLNWHFSATELLLPCQLLALQRAVANCFHPRITAQSNWLRGCAIPSDAPTPWHRGAHRPRNADRCWSY